MSHFRKRPITVASLFVTCPVYRQGLRSHASKSPFDSTPTRPCPRGTEGASFRNYGLAGPICLLVGSVLFSVAVVIAISGSAPPHSSSWDRPGIGEQTKGAAREPFTLPILNIANRLTEGGAADVRGFGARSAGCSWQSGRRARERKNSVQTLHREVDVSRYSSSQVSLMRWGYSVQIRHL